MTTDIVDLNNFIVLIEESHSGEPIVQECTIETDVVGFAFYGSGSIELQIKHNDQTKYMTNTTGLAISFFSNQKVAFSHTIAPHKPLQSISVFTRVKNLHTLSQAEKEVFEERVPQLMNPKENFVTGPHFYMNLEMQQAVQNVFANQYTGNTRSMFLRSKVTELIAHFFALLASEQKRDMAERDKEKLYEAREIITTDLSKPPSINELSKRIGINSTKLKKNFKDLFGLPVYKFLHEERLKKAYDLLCNGDMGVQETSWYVGYDSLSSFSNAFFKKFGVRPNDLRQQFRSNKS